MKPTTYQVSASRVLSELNHLVTLIQTTANQKPFDPTAQRRALAATEFVNSFTVSSLDTCKRERCQPPLPTEPISRFTGLPIELHQLVISHVDEFDPGSRQRTLVALCCSCKTLMNLAETYLYAHPQDLSNVRRQWTFLFSISVEPARGHLVRSLRLLWLGTGENSQVLVDIARACPNASELFVQRGQGWGDGSSTSQVDIGQMAALLGACPRLTSLHYSTTFEDNSTDGETAQPWLRKVSQDARFKQRAQKMSSLNMSGSSGWLVQILLPHVSSTLTSLHLSTDVSLGDRPHPLSELSRQSPSLQSLVVQQTLSTSADLEAACKKWGSTLQLLNIASIEGISDWVTQIMPYMKVLNTLILGPGCCVLSSDVEAIARSAPLLRYISFGDLDFPANGSDEDVATDGMNLALSQMIDTHSSILQHLDLGYNVRVGRRVVQACVKATKMRALFLRPSSDTEALEIDCLLESCPNLVRVSRSFTRFSRRLDEWRARETRTAWADHELS
ncbi:hypothetical protein F66182_2426 [Fusarium sp. NRRL 66182]|nr:hypothetical protein F66182_2426 [Fusarium sp. NRRL 66182]